MVLAIEQHRRHDGDHWGRRRGVAVWFCDEVRRARPTVLDLMRSSVSFEEHVPDSRCNSNPEPDINRLVHVRPGHGRVLS